MIYHYNKFCIYVCRNLVINKINVVPDEVGTLSTLEYL